MRHARRLIAVLAATALASSAEVALALSQAAAADTAVDVDGVSLVWALNDTATSGAYYGGCNFLSAGLAADHGSSAVWTKANPGYASKSDAVAIEKPDSTGTYARPTWSTKCTGPDGGTAVTLTTSSLSRVRITGGTGTADPSTDSATIAWSGSFTSAFYGGMSYWSATDPVLTVTNGTGALTATVSGYGASMNDSSVWTVLKARTVTLATLSGVQVTSTGITVTPTYTGVVNGQSDQVTTGTNAGSWPTSFIDFQLLTGQSSYWYSSGLHDAAKKPGPITIAYPKIDTGSGTPTTTPTTSTPATPSATTSPTRTTTSAAPTTSTSPRTSTSTTRTTTTKSAQTCKLSQGVRGGHLIWGFKKSFRSYVSAGFPANSITAGQGATILKSDLARSGVAGTGSYRWPFTSSSRYTSGSSFAVQFGGKVTFDYPGHYFTITIANPEVVVSGTTGRLNADVTVKVTEPGTKAKTTTRKGEKLATVSLSGTSATTTSTGITRLLHTKIADADSFSFGGQAFYTKGQALDDATILMSGCTTTTSSTGTTDTGTSETDSTQTSSNTDSNSTDDLVPSVRFRPQTSASPTATSSARTTVTPEPTTAGQLSIPGTTALNSVAETVSAKKSLVLPVSLASALAVAGAAGFYFLRRRATSITTDAAEELTSEEPK